jgi:RNA polymerase sigma factor (sigma-70 family)
MAQQTPTTPSGGDGQFRTTHWSVILAAGDLAASNHKTALDQFCQAYWRPVYVFVLKKGYPREEAQDLTQDFFLSFLKKNKLAGLSRERGRFRAFLLTVLKNFLINDWRHKNTEKRGDGKMLISIDQDTETRFQKYLSDNATPEVLFDLEWARAVLVQVRILLREKYAEEGKPQVFDCLQYFLPGAHEVPSQAEAAKTLGMSEEAVRMAVHRLRVRFGKLLRQEIATPGTSREQVEEEIRYLLEVLSRK